jgi:hypothetical protein
LIRRIDLGIFYVDHTHIPGRQAYETQHLVHGSIYPNQWYLSSAMRRFLDMPRMRYPVSANAAPCIQEWASENAAPVLLLMRMAPNLTSLRLQVPSSWNMDALGQGEPDGTFFPKFTFPNLKHLGVVAATPDLWTEDSCRTIIGCLLAATPNLESLELSHCTKLDRELILPPQLVSLDLIHSHLTGSNLQHMLRRAPNLKRIGFYDSCVPMFCDSWHPPPTSLTADRLLPLSQCPAATTLETLVFAGVKLGPMPKNILAQFRDLKVLGIQCGNDFEQPVYSNGIDLLIDLIKGCQQLRGLLLTDGN